MVNGGQPISVNLKQSNSSKKKPSFTVKVHPPKDDDSPAQRSSGLETPADAARPFAHIRSRYMSMISPRSSNYERLEGGHGPTRTGPAKRFAWKKFAIAAAVLITMVYFFGPRESKSLPWNSKAKEPGMYY